VVDIPYAADAYYVWDAASPNTTYYYRVKTWNNGGEGDWSVGSFQTIAPFIQVTVPNGGEAWRRGLPYFVQWNDDLAENVNVDLYKAGSFVRNLATNAPSTGAYKWAIPASLTPGSDYSIKVSSSTNAALFDTSDNTFCIIDAPVMDAGSVTRLADGQVQFGLTVPGAAQATVLGSTNLSVWEVLQTVPLTNGSAVFMDGAATNFPCRFYRLRVP
jgi:hypothetical protein